MTSPNIQQAREWAERVGKIEGLMPGHHAAAEVIQSLPDTVVDGDKLREVIADWGNREVTPDAYTLYRQVLALLPTLPCPEDVPDPHPGEAWLVNTREGEQREALKAGNRWYVKDGDDVEEWVEEALTPIARLVPEVAP